MTKSRIILLVDMESFYASVEIVRDPSLRGRPVVVCGDPERRRGVVLAASKEAKAYGIKTAMLAGECRKLCPHVVFVRPHMSEYLAVSVKITETLSRFTDRLVPYSIDEQFMDMTGCEKLFGSPQEMARSIIREVGEETGVRCRAGIGENPLQAKMACDCFAKKNGEGIFRLNSRTFPECTWPLPARSLFGVGVCMERNLYRMGVRTIGHLAGLSRESLKRRWGINGEILWLNAHGIDYSTISPGLAESRKGVSYSMTLPRDYRDKEEIKTVLLEITDEVCRRARILRKLGKVINVYCRGADFAMPTGFSRRLKLPDPTAFPADVFPPALKLFMAHWDRRPIRAIGLGLSQLVDDNLVQLSLVNPLERKINLYRAMDEVRERFGPTALFRLSSLTPGGQLFDRATRIGGH